jgi:hypothetical protein
MRENRAEFDWRMNHAIWYLANGDCRAHAEARVEHPALASGSGNTRAIGKLSIGSAVAKAKMYGYALP